jgi:hypothetical protein
VIIDKPPFEIYARSSTYNEGYYIELLDSKNPLIGGKTQKVMKETISKLLKTIEVYTCFN